MDLFQTIPGYREAVEREQFVRAAAFMRCTVDVAGLPTRLMTIRDWIALDMAKCNYVAGGRPEYPDAAMLLWRLAPEYVVGSRFARWRRMRQVRKVIRRIGLINVLLAVRDYVLDVFQDAPGGDGNQLSVPPVHWSIYIVGTLAQSFSWDCERVLDMPVPAALQFVRHIQLNANHRASMFNPSDRVRGEWLRKQNQAMQ